MSKSRLRRVCRGMAAFGLSVVTAATALAGVPFVTDDPGTAGKGHYEINIASFVSDRKGETGGALASVDANYGVTDHFDVHVYVPLAFDHTSGPYYGGVGDLEFGVNYRFVEGDDWGWKPSVAVAPTITAPVGSYDHNLGTGDVHAFIPIWFGKEFGKWTAFGGGGYAINPGYSNKDWIFAGAGLTYELNPKWTLGGEVFFTTAAVKGEKDGSAFNLGGIYTFDDRYHLMFSAGRNLTNARAINDFSAFIGLQISL